MEKTYSIVIPCYNCEKHIELLINNIKKTLKEEIDYEIILINDGSKDLTWNIISSLAKKDSIIKAINFSQNFGQHSAMMAGYRKSKGNYIIGMDDDGENSPKDIFKLIDEIEKGYDIVCADYEVSKKRIRRIGTIINNKMAEYLLNKPKDITLTSFYICKRFVIEQVVKYKYCYPYVAGLLLQTTKNWGKVILKKGKRIEGSSGYNLNKLIKLWINGFTAFSVKPLRLSSLIGIIFSIIGIIMAIICIIKKYLLSDVVSGYTSIMSALCFFSGIITLLLGLIGEYVGRIYVSINNSPQYVICEEIDKENE